MFRTAERDGRESGIQATDSGITTYIALSSSAFSINALARGIGNHRHAHYLARYIKYIKRNCD